MSVFKYYPRRSRSQSSDASDDNSIYEQDASENEEPENKDPRKSPNNKYKFTSSYFNYLSDFRNQQQDRNLSVVEFARKAGKAWKRLSPGEREPYESAAAANRKKQVKKPGMGRVAKAKAARNKKKLKAAKKMNKKVIKKGGRRR